MKLRYLLYVTFGITALLSGCQGKDGDPGPAGGGLTGNVYGFVNAYDDAGSLLSKSGVTVTLEGATPAVTTTSDANGRYEFQGLKAGTYNFTYNRSGLGVFRRDGVAHVGGDQATFLGVTSLTEPSNTRAAVVSAASNQQLPGIAVVQVGLANPNLPGNSLLRFVVLVGSTPDVTVANGQWNGTVYGTSSGQYGVSLSRASLNALGFATGSTAYVAAYGISAYTVYYLDPITGRYILPGLNPGSSTAVSFIVP